MPIIFLVVTAEASMDDANGIYWVASRDTAALSITDRQSYINCPAQQKAWSFRETVQAALVFSLCAFHRYF